jgi:hypothetical protein
MRKAKPLIPKSHMDSSYLQQLEKLSEELDLQYDQQAELEAAKQSFEAEAKEILELEASWNNLVKMAVMDRAERKRCLIG